MIGTTVSHYQVTGKLGVGGMGVVYDATDGRLGRSVALKFLPHDLADDPDASRRLQREAQTLARLNHPNICTVYGIEEHASGAFMVMERCDGVNLKVHMARNTLTNQEIVDIASQIGAALAAAHTAGIVHRDIKPGNIVVSPIGQVKVLDFGLARRFMMPDTGEIVVGGSTIPGRPLGTANYMAPERILQLPLDPRSDLFSLGVVIYEMATGRLPFAGVSPSETVTNILENEAPSLTALSPDRPPQLARIVNRLLAKSAESRYQNAASLHEDLRTLTAPKRFWQRLTDR
jgi:serine/threonine protein kinase